MASSSSSSSSANAGTGASTSTNAASTSSSSAPSPLVMQLILPRSLPTQPGWSTGPLIAQGAHAACAILALTSQHALTREYLSPEGLRGGMHKVVMQWPGKEKKNKNKGSAAEGVGAGQEEEQGLEELSKRLSAGRAEWEKRQQERTVSRDQGEEEAEEEFPEHTMWIEQPDNIPTCIAIAPNRKPPALKKILNKCALFRG